MSFKNRVIIEKIQTSPNRIDYTYSVQGDWVEAFNLNEKFFVEYSLDISFLPKSIAVIPLLANLLPMAWVYDAEIVCPECDKTFYDCIPQVKEGYKNMYPMMTLGGKVSVEAIIENRVENAHGAGSFFSGGVDAFDTLVCHEKEKPTLITLWGADVKLEDVAGWQRVDNHISQVAKEFGVDFASVRSNFRRFLQEGVLNKRVQPSGDLWWHGFHHGIGIISHGAPIAYLLKKKALYIASSFHISQKGRYTCASDPTIDNFIRFSDTRVIHDGYERTRQNKVANITDFSKRTEKKIPLRVCWESEGGGNCCQCEKCFRTMLAIYAQGFCPKDFGFEYTQEELKTVSKTMRRVPHPCCGELRYGPIHAAMRQNIHKKDLPKELRWFYSIAPKNFGKHPYVLFWRKVRAKLKSMITKGKGTNGKK